MSRHHFPLPRTRRGRVLAGVTGGALAVVVGLGIAYAVLFAGGNSPPPLTLAPTTAATVEPGATPAPTLTSAQLAGAWKVGSGSVAGYRVREQLALLAAPSDAVGRTSSVTGSVTVTDSASGATVSAASIAVDVSTLTSDKAMRDQRIHSIGLETDQFPTAMFMLTAPIALSQAATGGQPFAASATGQLTLHGTTKTVTIPLTARLSSAALEVVGSITFPFSDFGMTPPSIGGFVSVQDNATMEFDLHLAR